MTTTAPEYAYLTAAGRDPLFVVARGMDRGDAPPPMDAVGVQILTETARFIAQRDLGRDDVHWVVTDTDDISTSVWPKGVFTDDRPEPVATEHDLEQLRDALADCRSSGDPFMGAVLYVARRRRVMPAGITYTHPDPIWVLLTQAVT